ncbi:hypothetical protein QBC32DRAFT_143689 [Pseudoneurospora amorphoporcata]|uniref:Nucleoporin NUP37 n=1 Tax=Pseudoneurospora amorphoporcata TaxID=241081 RepID=A0AAN6NUL1_9PEZI|nr:hypothetical protein QBC32DRAFT_143689 [Pseudoneurospora amorphoporcata]
MQSTTPRTRRTPQSTQFIYPLKSRVYDIKTYPVQTPQGATVLIYGHENGVALIWRGGRKLKTSKTAADAAQNGGKPEDAVMIIDSDDESPAIPSASFVDKPEFDDTVTTDASSLADIVQTLDLAFGTAVHHIAVLPMPTCTVEDAAWNGALILRERIAFVVTCANGDVHVVTLPLTPPSNESKTRPALKNSLLAGNAGKGAWGETLTLLAGQGKPSEGVAITLVKEQPGLGSSQGRKGSATRAIVAAHTREASGTLRFWHVPLDATPGTTARVEPFQTEYLPSPLGGISFNPLHVTQLLVVDPAHAVRIYDYSIPSLPSDDTSEGPFPSQGSWLVSLYQPFARGAGMSTSRKPVVGAEWMAHGRAVLVLLADGQWGIWDIDNANPTTTSSAGLFTKANSGLRGSAITQFSVSGYLQGTTTGAQPQRNLPTTTQKSAPLIVPLAVSASAPEKLATIKGGVYISQLPLPRNGLGEESAVLWLANTGADHTNPVVCIIPIISRFWDAQLKRTGGNLWNSSSQPSARMLHLTHLGAGLLGERLTAATAIPRSTGSLPESTEGKQLPIETLLLGESRLIVIHETEEAFDHAASAAAVGASSSTERRLIPLPARKKARLDLTNGTAKAILAYPKPEQPSSVAFNLSLARPERGEKLLRPKALEAAPQSLNASFDGAGSTQDIDEEGGGTDTQDTVALSAFGGNKSQSQSQGRDPGLLFINDLNFAADVEDDKSEAEGRDIEAELMDIMEIDRELEELESQRGSQGTKRVFFEEG